MASRLSSPGYLRGTGKKTWCGGEWEGMGEGHGSVSGKELKGMYDPPLMVDFYCQPSSSPKVIVVLGYWGELLR